MRSLSKYFSFAMLCISICCPNLAKAQENTIPTSEGVDVVDNKQQNETEEGEYRAYDGLYKDNLNTELESILFEQKRLNKFYDIIKNYKTNGGVLPVELDEDEDIESDEDKIVEEVFVEDIDEQKVYEEVIENYIAPSFHLSTILYESPKSWTIWVNNQKIRTKNKDSAIPDLKILEVYKSSIAAIWSGYEMDKLSPDYKNNLIKINPQDEGQYTWSYKSKRNDVFVDSIRGAVKFNIGSGQSFSLYDMKIFEGKVDSVTVGNATSLDQEVTSDKSSESYIKAKESFEGVKKRIQKSQENEGLDL